MALHFLLSFQYLLSFFPFSISPEPIAFDIKIAGWGVEVWEGEEVGGSMEREGGQNRGRGVWVGFGLRGRGDVVLIQRMVRTRSHNVGCKLVGDVLWEGTGVGQRV